MSVISGLDITKRVLRRRVGTRLVRAVGATQSRGVRATYAGVLDGVHLWCAVDIGSRHIEDLALRGRSADALIPLNATVVEEEGERRLEVCADLSPLHGGREVFDLVAIAGKRALRVQSPAAGVSPRNGVAVVSDDGQWRRKAYTTRGGMLAISCLPLETCAEVTTVNAYPGVVQVSARIRGVADAEPSVKRLEIKRRADGCSISFPAKQTADGGFRGDIPMDELVEAFNKGSDETWDVFVVADPGLRLGRRTSDLGNLRQAMRYVSAVIATPSGDRVSVRPYYTNDRYLALEVSTIGNQALNTEQVHLS